MKRYIKILDITWLGALLVNIINVTIAVVVPIMQNGEFYFGVKNNLYLYLVICAVILGLVFYNNKSFKTKCRKLQKENFLDKLIKYKAIYSKMNLIHILVAFIGLIYCFVTKGNDGMVFALLALVLTIISKQNPTIIKFNLALTEEELSKFNHVKFN